MKANLIIILILFFLSSCSLTDEENYSDSIFDLNVPAGFTFSLEKEVELTVELHSNDGSAIPGIVYNVYYVNYLDQLKRIGNYVTDEDGMIESEIRLPYYVDSVYLSGFMNSQEITVVNNKIEYHFIPEENNRETEPLAGPSLSREFSYVDGVQYNSQGAPVNSDIIDISGELLTRIDTSLPETVSLVNSHPQYLEDGITTNLVIEDSSDVWITFITEGAGHKNALGYYTYDIEDGPPEDPSEMEHILIFPNCSLLYSGGGMQTGMQIYLGQFGAGTVMGWFLVQNGWLNGINVSETRERFYSDRMYNPEEEEYNQHSVLLYDAESELFLMAFEDLVRPGGDNDFNDAVFFATANPIENINTDNIPPIDIPVDDDGDGVNNPFDEYPDDPERAFFVYYPSEDEEATLVFEDKWPTYGDYDMNDMVLDYHYKMVTNADDEVKDITFNYTLRAAGAFFNNGFSLLLPYEYSNISLGVSSDNIDPGLFEDGEYTILDFYNAATEVSGINSGEYLNTDESEPYYEPESFSVKITLTEAVNNEELDFSLPFNPFIRQRGDIDHEVHLMNYAATSRMNTELFQTEDDDSEPGNGRFFTSQLNLPWALNLPENWKYPAEKNTILETYIHFADWAESGGLEYSDWFTDSPDNYNENKIYVNP